MNLLLSISFNGIFNSLTGGVAQGLTWGLLAIAVYISFRILNTADMTVDGSLALGGVLTAVLISCGWHFILAMIVAVISSALAGAITGILHTKLKIPAILAGILTMSALYSVNMALMSGKSSIAILEFNTLKTMWGNFPITYVEMITSTVLVIIVISALYWFFGTEIGSSIRATGDNEQMSRAQGINTDNTKILGLTISNALAGLAGSIITQINGSADVNMATGTIVIGLASVVIGEIVFGHKLEFWGKLLSVVVGSIIYRIIIVIAYLLNMPTMYTKLLSAIIIALALGLPILKSKLSKSKENKQGERKC